MAKINFRSILVECGKNNCTNGNTICDIVDACWNDKVLDASEDWYNRFKNMMHNFTPQQVQKQIDNANAGNKWFGNIVKIPTKYTKSIKSVRKTKSTAIASNNNSVTNTSANTTRKTKSASSNSSNTYNLRTVLTLCGQNNVTKGNLVKSILKKMVSDNKLSQDDYDWFNQSFTSDNRIAKVIENTVSGKTTWGNKPIQEFKDFNKYLPLSTTISNAVADNNSIVVNLNNRSVIAALAKKNKCDDALEVATVLSKFGKAGFKNVDYKTIPNLVSMNESQIKKLGNEAVKGTGIFKGEKLIKDDILNKIDED